MPHNIAGVRVLAPPDQDSHSLVTRRGDVIRFSISEPDYTVGRTRGEMLGFPGGAWVPASSAPGRLPEAVSYELVVAPRPALTLRQRTEALARALPLAAELHRPDGRYLRVYSAEVEDYTDGGDTLTALFKPKSEVWRYPLLDDAFPEVLSTVFETEQSTEGAPIYATTPGSRLTAPITAARMPQGTMFVGLRTEATGVYGIASLGAAVGPDGTPKTQALGMYKNNGTYVAHVGTATATALQGAAGGYGLLKVLAMRWRENGLLSFYSFGANGFADHGSTALGEVEPFALRQITLGVLSNFAGVEGFFMPGAPALGDFGVPFYTPRYWTEREVEDALGAMYPYLAQFDNLTIPPPPYGLTLTVGTAPDAVVGREVRIPLTVVRDGGFLGDFEFDVTTPDPALRVIGVSEDSEGAYNLTLLPEEGILAETFSVQVTVRAVGQQTSAPLANVIDTKSFDITIRLGDPALPEGTTFFNAMYDPRNKSFTTMAKSEITGGPTVQLGGLARWSTRWDAIVCDGTSIAPWGSSLAWVDTNLEMGVDHSVSASFWDVPGMAVNTVLMTFSSRTLANKLQFWQVYKAADGLRLKTSFGGNTFTSGQGLPLVGGIMDISVVRSETGLTLENPKTEERITIGWRAWAGLGRLTFFGARLADGSVQGLSKGVVLNMAGQNRAVSTFQLERQAELMRGYVLRTAQWERPEMPPGTYAIFLGDPGQVLRNYHPATASQSMIPKGAGATVTGGSFKTTGADETGFRTGWITGSDAAKPNDIIYVMRDMSTGGSSGLAKFALTFYGDQNNYYRFGRNSSTIAQFFASYRTAGETSVLLEDASPESGGIPMTGVQAFVQRLDPSRSRVSVEHIASRRSLSTTYDNWTLSGTFQASIGATYRGIGTGGVLRGESVGLESEVAAESLGIIMVARHTTTQEAKDAETNIVSEYDYSGAPVAGAGSGGSTAPTGGGGGTVAPAASDMTAVAIPAGEWNATTLFGASGPMRTMSDRLVTALGTGGWGTQSNAPLYAWNDLTASIRGQYQISRSVGRAALSNHMALCATKDVRWAKQSQVIWNRARALFDRDSRPESYTDGIYDGWTWGTSSNGETRDTTGQRIALEAGVMAKAVVHAYNMHLNKHLDSTFQTSINQILDWWDNHYVAEWDAYRNNTLPLHSQKNFSHTTTSEIVAGFARALIANGANWAAHPEGVDAINGWNLWYGNAATTKIIPVGDFKDAAWASYGPARLWGQRSQGWGGTGSQFTQYQTYLDETYASLTFLYIEGFLTHVLGSQAAADNFMVEVVSGANLGVWVEPLRVKGLVAGAMNGYLKAADNPTGVAGTWMYVGDTFGSTYTDYNTERKILEGDACIQAFDSSHRITTIFDDVLSRNSSARDGTSWNYSRGNVTRLYAEIWRYGRKNS